MRPLKTLAAVALLAITAPAMADVFTWDGGTGDWIDANWSGGLVAPDENVTAAPSLDYLNDDFTIGAGADISTANRVTLTGGSLAITGATVSLAPPSNDLSGLNIGFNTGGTRIATTVTVTDSTLNVSPNGLAGRAVQVRGGSTLTLDNSTVNISGGSFPALEAKGAASKINVNNGSSINAAYIRLDDVSRMDFESGNITLSSSNSFRSNAGFDGNLNFNGANGAALVTTTNNTSGTSNLAKKIAQGFFSIDGTPVDPTTIETLDWTVVANLDTLAAELATLDVGGRTLLFTYDSVDPANNDMTVSVVPEPASLALLALGGLMMASRRRHA